jgi:hypothetical protein
VTPQLPLLIVDIISFLVLESAVAVVAPFVFVVGDQLVTDMGLVQ